MDYADAGVCVLYKQIDYADAPDAPDVEVIYILDCMCLSW